MRKFVLVVGAFVLLAGTAHARFYVPRHHHACKAGFVRRHARVRRHHRWVRQARCVRAGHAKRSAPRPVGAVAPNVSYSARVDPTFTQASSDPLKVTYDYSADATQTAGTVTTDLATVSQLPAGVLDFFSATSPGGPEQLFCSINVGGATTGSTCPITYGSTGTYDVTTEYIPNAASAVTETDPETISPYSTSTTLSVTKGSCGSGSPPGYSVPGPYCSYTLANSVVDQNGNHQGPQAVLQFAPNTGQASAGGSVPANGSCTAYVTSSWVLSPDCDITAGSGAYDAASWSATASYDGAPGWAPSRSSAQILVSQ